MGMILIPVLKIFFSDCFISFIDSFIILLERPLLNSPSMTLNLSISPFKFDNKSFQYLKVKKNLKRYFLKKILNIHVQV